jgi:FkbM family methyltransferase
MSINVQRYFLVFSLVVCAFYFFIRSRPPWEEESSVKRPGSTVHTPSTVATALLNPYLDMNYRRPFPPKWQVLVVQTEAPIPFWMALYYKQGSDKVAEGANTILRDGVWEKPMTDAFTILLKDVCNDGKIVVDVGANVGFFTLLSASFGCKVHAFEPQPENLKLLSMSLAINQDIGNRVTLHPNICSASKENLTFSGTDMDGHVTGTYNHKDQDIPDDLKKFITNYKDHSSIPVSTLSIDEAIQKEYGDDAEVELLKVDVEGYEPQVMESARTLLSRRKIRTLLFEYNMWRAMTEKQGVEMLSDLKSFGYTMYVALAPCAPYELAVVEDFRSLSQTLKNNTNKCNKWASMVVATLTQHPLEWYSFKLPDQ